MPICLRLPVRKSVDDICGLVQKLERFGGLSFIGRKELRGEIRQCVNQCDQRFLNSVVGIFGAGLAVRNGTLQLFLVTFQNFEGRRDWWARSLSNNLVTNSRMAFAYPLEDSSQLRSIEGLKKSGESERSANNFVRAGFLGRASKSSSRNGRRASGRHSLIAILVGFSLAGSHVVKGRQGPLRREARVFVVMRKDRRLWREQNVHIDWSSKLPDKNRQ
jgi:hypothetical protein